MSVNEGHPMEENAVRTARLRSIGVAALSLLAATAIAACGSDNNDNGGGGSSGSSGGSHSTDPIWETP